MTSAVKDFIPEGRDEIRQKLVEQTDLWALGAHLYGPGGAFDFQRKALLATIRQGIRDARRQANVKCTESELDDLAHSNERYTAFLDKHTLANYEFRIADTEHHLLLADLRFAERY